ncbi:hypothetical protein ABZ953_06860 [Streptomyces sp. NPDC046465]|uniref:hypothetical protein n=1 Tax=Streptomyces sp. NPDC046465 TaxID=3155810 RepID=UPI003404A50D
MRKLWRRLTTPKSPDCDRCGNPTGKPFLYNMPRTPWRCEPCEDEVTDIMLRIGHERSVRDIGFDVEAGLADLFLRLGPPPSKDE